MGEPTGVGMSGERARVRVWPPVEWCAAISPDRRSICDQPRDHAGEHVAELSIVSP